MLSAVWIAVPLVAFTAFVAVWAILLYNNLVLSRARTREAWSGIDVQLKRRSSLIPNLVEAVREFATHEHEVFTEMARARGMVANASGPQAAAAADQTLTQALGRLMVVVESYPQLKMASNFTRLQEELTDSEEKIAYARQFYNQNVLDYNTSIQGFPGNQFARWFRFEPEIFFTADPSARQDVRVSFTAA